MRIVIAGGHGQIALILERLLTEAGHEAVGIIRSAEQTADLVAVGAEALLLDLEATDAQTLAGRLGGADAVVFAAGGGPSGGAARKLTVDRDAAVLLADAAEQAGIRRYVMISAMGADGFDPGSDDIFQIYLRAKSEADAVVRARDLDWTIIRPGGLTDEDPGGLVEVARSTGRGSIPRADVAAVVVEVLVGDLAVGEQLELISGDTDIRTALSRR